MDTLPTSPEQQAMLLDAAYKALLDDPAAAVPAGLDPALAATAQRVAQGLSAPEPRSEFAAQLRVLSAASLPASQVPSTAGMTASPVAAVVDHPALSTQSAGDHARAAAPRHFTFARTWRRAAVLLLAAAVGAYVLSLPLQPVSAQEIMRRAQVTLAVPLDIGVQSYFIAEETTVWAVSPAAETSAAGTSTGADLPVQASSMQKRWFAAPDRWRVESNGVTYDTGGRPQPAGGWESVAVSDGRNQYDYDALGRVLAINLLPQRHAAPDARLPLSPAGELPVTSLTELFAQMATCYRPVLAGSDEIAGRPVHVIDLGATLCPSASAPEMNGRELIYVDKETYFVLGRELYATRGDRLVLRSVATAVEYGIAIDPAQFTFTAPAGAQVMDYRPQALALGGAVERGGAVEPDAAGGAGAEEMEMVGAALKEALDQLAQEVSFPVFAPVVLPPELEPRAPKLMPQGQAGGQVLLEFVSPAEVLQDTYAGAGGIVVTQQAATYADVVNYTQGATSVLLPGAAADAEVGAWVRRGEMNVDGTGSDAAAIVLRDGVLLTASSFVVEPEELLAFAAEFVRVPHSVPPLPNPQPPTLAEVRAEAPFPIYVPTFVPEGLLPGPPVGYEISYTDRAGNPVLTVTNGTGLAEDPRFAGEVVTLRNGAEAHLLPALLWLVADGRTPVALYSKTLDAPALMEIAASLSATYEPVLTAPIQQTPAAAVPSPTPMPTPSFVVRRPTWLPEEMAVREQVAGDIVSLGFVPRDGGSQGVLTLVQRPVVVGENVAAGDPQASVEQLGPYTVTVIRRGAEGCVTYIWTAAGVQLTLTNVYDRPGELKYSCEEMSRIVEGVR